MHIETMTLYSAVLLPIFLLYLLIILRMVERRQMPFEERRSVWSILNVRDAALVTLALDISEVSSGFIPAFLQKESPLAVAVATVLFFLHLMVYVLSSRHSSQFERPRLYSKNFSRSLLDAYFVLTLLMTNAVTLMDFMRAMGKGL